jgi:hypothetical protein
MTGITSWAVFHQRWAGLRPPLRPHPDVCEAVRTLVSGHDASVLLLGATPELAEIPAQTIAVDRNALSLGFIWPGNTPARAALRGNWLALPCADGAFTAAIGDGSLSCLEYPVEYERVLYELSRAVRPRGRIVLRVYLRPDRPESTTDIYARAMSGAAGSPHALKWMVAHAACAERNSANLPVAAILDAYDRAFPDRQALSDATGWCLDEVGHVDAYAEARDVYSFPTKDQLLDVVAGVGLRGRLLPVGSYPLAERCPLLAIDLE